MIDYVHMLHLSEIVNICDRGNHFGGVESAFFVTSDIWVVNFTFDAFVVMYVLKRL